MTHLSIAKPPAELWKTLAACHDFPILEESRQRIRLQMQNRSVSFEDLAGSIERDPALCLHLLRLSVERHPGCNEQISGAASCLSLLGMQELVKLIKNLPVVSADSEDSKQQLYRRALLTAQLAGNLAAEWATVKGNPSVSYARWSTMLTSAPLWLALLHYQPAQNWLHLLSQGKELGNASRLMFDNTLSAIQKLSRALYLPVMAVTVFQPKNWPTAAEWRVLRHHDPRDLDNQRQLIHHCQQPAMISLIANSLAWHWHMAPDSR
ncbi:MAG: HDOD domain-containing protein, partial [Saccharospirillaceae bacterium]|nr:HDOD domain-containing protein [Saccharospirillaceae bacterium]